MTVQEFTDNIIEGYVDRIDQYNFLEEKTEGFKIEKIKILLKDFELYKFIFHDKISFESQDIYKKNEWEIPFNNVVIEGKEYNIPDHNTMIKRTHFSKFDCLDYCINILKDRIKQPKQDKPKTDTERTFTSIFTPEYALGTKQTELKAILSRNNYLEDGKWIALPKGKKNEPAKIYLYLQSKGVIKNNIDKTNGLKTFYCEFGLRAYTDKEKRENEKDVTVKSLSNTFISKTEKTLFENIFSSFLTTK